MATATRITLPNACAAAGSCRGTQLRRWAAPASGRPVVVPACEWTPPTGHEPHRIGGDLPGDSAVL
jgi:hypothetical protein